MIISFEFPDSTLELKVDLVDNPAIRSWAEHFLAQPLEVRSHIINNARPQRPDFTRIAQLYESCVNNINKLAELGFVYDGPMPESIKDLDRSWCNRAHRFFTHTQKYVNDMQIPLLSCEEVVAQREYITSFLQPLNDDIHSIEDYFLPNAYGAVNFDAEEIYCSSMPTYNDPGWWQMDETWRQYHTLDHATVIFGPQILGKAIARSYLDGDNPNDWDTTGHYCNNGALLIQVSNWRNDLYTSDSFKEWIKKWGLESNQVFYDFPVGHVKDKQSVRDVYTKLRNTNGTVKTIYRHA